MKLIDLLFARNPSLGPDRGGKHFNVPSRGLTAKVCIFLSPNEDILTPVYGFSSSFHKRMTVSEVFVRYRPYSLI